MDKVVVFDTWKNGNKKAKEYQCSVLLTINISGKLVVFRCGDEWCGDRWTIIPESLEDRVLFLGEDCAFSSLTFDLTIGYGNCVIFRDDVYCNSQSNGLGVGVFDLGQLRIMLLSCFPCYSMFFWPPPKWAGLR